MPPIDASYDQNSFIIKINKSLNLMFQLNAKQKNMENILIKFFPVKTMNIGYDEDYYILKNSHNTFVLTEGNHHNAC